LNWQSLKRNMVEVPLKGVHKVKAKGRLYYYAWRGGPPIKDAEGNYLAPGDPGFLTAYNDLVAETRSSDKTRFAWLVEKYKGSDEYKALADSTKRVWGPWLDKIKDHFGKLRISQFDRTEKLRPIIRKWRAKWSKQPRTADLGMQVLSRICSHGVDPEGVLTSNPCIGIKHLYKGDRSDIIWLDPDIAVLKEHTSKEVAWAVDLAAHTGLRMGDLLRLSWSHVGENEITLYTSKGKKQRLVAIIPLYDALRTLLDAIPRRATTVLTNTRKRPWTTDGFGTSFDDAKIAAKMKPNPTIKGDNTPDLDKHFHDLRGTAATKFYIAGIPIRSIAEIMAWDEESVEKIIRRYVNRTALTKALIAQMNDAGTKTVKPAVKL
jgi:integrase